LTGRRYPIHLDPGQAWNELHRHVSGEDLICVTGSFFIAAEIRRLIRPA
jgi:folylpolyglutamate synthase/dihydropteroate synthase